MSPLEYSRERLRAFLQEVNRVKESDFPHDHPKSALLAVEQHFSKRLADLSALTAANDPKVIETACAEATWQLFIYLPLLGFILRSTNVRNSFEIYGPLLRLSRQILGPDTKLILSSEWEYSPFTFVHFAELPSYVLIGLPASESTNPLVIPLAGHEAGHTIWKQRSLAKTFGPQIEGAIYTQIQARLPEYVAFYPKPTTSNIANDLFVLQVVAAILAWAVRQAEETFCDLIGLRLFGESYFHAFAYLLCPGLTGPRSHLYPNMTTRVTNMITAAGQWGVSFPTGYDRWFVDQVAPATHEKERLFLLSLADSSLPPIIPGLIGEVETITRIPNLNLYSNEKVAAIRKAFGQLIPPSEAGSIANILNAAWQAYHDPTLWADMPHIAKSRASILSELVLKSIEVLEIEQLMRKTT